MKISLWPIVIVALVSGLCCAGTVLADEKLDQVVEKLGSSSVSDRINALRDLGRMGLPAQQARPLLEQMSEDPVEAVREEVVAAVQELLGANGGDLLEKFYNDPERRVRDAAIHAACAMFDSPRPHDLCTVAFDDPDHSSRVDVLVTLKEQFPRHKDAARLFRRGLKDPSELVQRAAVFGCQAARDKQAVDLLNQAALNSSDQVAVPAVVEALATIATPRAVDYLIKMLPRRHGKPGKPAKPSDDVRAAAARALARIKDPRALPELRKLLDDAYTPVRIGAMEGLFQMKDTSAVPLIAKQLEEEDERLRRFALRALRVIGDASAASAVRKALKSDKLAVVRATAVGTLADLVGVKAIPDLKAQSNDLDASVRLEVAGALAGLGKVAAPALSQLVNDAAPEVRAIAIEGMGQIGGPEEIPSLVAAAKDKSRRNRQVRVSVADALGRIGDRSGLKHLIALSKDTEPAVRQRAAQSLGRIGGKSATEALGQLLRDKVARVRNTARRELERLKKAPAPGTK